MPSISFPQFERLVRDHAGDGALCVPISIRVLGDQLTPVLAYRRLVAGDERTAPSFLLESVEGGERQGRYSIMGAEPMLRVIATGHEASVLDGAGGTLHRQTHADPIALLREIASEYRLCTPAIGQALPSCVLGGWFGYAGYDTIRYAEPAKLPFDAAPRDDRDLPDLEFGLYDGVIVFDHVDKVVHVVQLAIVRAGADAQRVYDEALARLEERAARIQRHSKPLPLGRMGPDAPPRAMESNISKGEHAQMVARAQEYIRAGDIFQVVLGQRFERTSTADPFDVYRCLRAVNPSPYMVYMQTSGCLLVASSPEILCRVRHEGEEEALVVTNRPLAGTRRRGGTPDEDLRLERELLADPKERAEHAMLVDLGRNDVGKVSRPESVELKRCMEIERYSHVMHISSTVTGALRDGLDAWDALRAALPVGTISGAPKIRAMQIIDELEPLRRGPYGGGMGYASLDGDMDLALALRTMIVPIALRNGDSWTYHVQAAGGIVADSCASDEYQETVNKAAALARAIDLAESAFAPDSREGG